MNIAFLFLLFILQIILFYSFGLITSKVLKLHLTSVTVTLFTGFIFFFCLFGLLAIPMIIACLPLSALTYTIAAVSAAALTAFVLMYYKKLPSLRKIITEKSKPHSYMLYVLLFVVFIQQLVVFNWIDWSADACYYIGKVSTDVYTNTMGQYDPYTGAALKYLDSRRIFGCFQEYNAVISQFFHIHPLKQAKLIMPQILALFTSLLYYQIGLKLFRGEQKKADLLVCFMLILDLFSYTLYTNASFLFTRTYEGKSILANIVIPGLFYCFLLLWEDHRSRFACILLTAISFASCIFSSSSMLVVPVGLTAGLLPLIVKEKQWKKLWLYAICILPNLFVCMMYLLSTKGLVVYPIGG